MSRNFENEYRNFCADDVPDLWSRIEGNLKEKEPVSVSTKTELKTIQKAKNKKITRIYMKKYAVAACLCLVILVGGVIAVYRGKVYGLNNAMVATDMATSDEVMDFEMAEDVAPMEDFVADSGVEESELIESGMLLDATREESAWDDSEGSILQNKNEVALNSSQMDSTESIKDAASEEYDGESDSAESEVEASESASEESLESEEISAQAVVKIISIENTGEEILYVAQVFPSVYSGFEPGTLLILCMGDMVGSEPEMGMTYKVEIEQLLETQTIENEIIYMIKGIEQQVE